MDEHGLCSFSSPYPSPLLSTHTSYPSTRTYKQILNRKKAREFRMVPTIKMTTRQRKTEAKFFTQRSNLQPSDPRPDTPLAELYLLITNGFLCFKDPY